MKRNLPAEGNLNELIQIPCFYQERNVVIRPGDKYLQGRLPHSIVESSQVISSQRPRFYDAQSKFHDPSNCGRPPHKVSGCLEEKKMNENGKFGQSIVLLKIFFKKRVAGCSVELASDNGRLWWIFSSTMESNWKGEKLSTTWMLQKTCLAVASHWDFPSFFRMNERLEKMMHSRPRSGTRRLVPAG